MMEYQRITISVVANKRRYDRLNITFCSRVFNQLHDFDAEEARNGP